MSTKADFEAMTLKPWRRPGNSRTVGAKQLG